MTDATVISLPVTLSLADRAVVAAILNTHAEMQDQQAMQTSELLARLMRDEPVAAAEMIANLGEDIADIEVDAENLKRLARMFM